MNSTELQQGFEKLNQLAQGDYHEPLDKVANSRDKKALFDRIGRLVGVTLKEPFAEPEEWKEPSLATHSYRRWQLIRERLADPSLQASWQYRTLEALSKENLSGRQFRSIEDFALDAHHERGFFGYLARSAQKYICGDAALRKKIDKSLRDAKKAGFSAKHLRPETLVQAGGLALGSLLVTQIPILGIVGAPVIAGLVLVLYTIGTDAFCEYVSEMERQDTGEPQ